MRYPYKDIEFFINENLVKRYYPQRRLSGAMDFIYEFHRCPLLTEKCSLNGIGDFYFTKDYAISRGVIFEKKIIGRTAHIENSNFTCVHCVFEHWVVA